MKTKSILCALQHLIFLLTLVACSSHESCPPPDTITFEGEGNQYRILLPPGWERAGELSYLKFGDTKSAIFREATVCFTPPLAPETRGITKCAYQAGSGGSNFAIRKYPFTKTFFSEARKLLDWDSPSWKYSEYYHCMTCRGNRKSCPLPPDTASHVYCPAGFECCPEPSAISITGDNQNYAITPPQGWFIRTQPQILSYGFLRYTIFVGVDITQLTPPAVAIECFYQAGWGGSNFSIIKAITLPLPIKDLEKLSTMWHSLSVNKMACGKYDDDVGMCPYGLKP